MLRRKAVFIGLFWSGICSSGQARELPITPERLDEMSGQLSQLQTNSDPDGRLAAACKLATETDALQRQQEAVTRNAATDTFMAFDAQPVSEARVTELATAFGKSVALLELSSVLSGKAAMACEIYRSK